MPLITLPIMPLERLGNAEAETANTRTTALGDTVRFLNGGRTVLRVRGSRRVIVARIAIAASGADSALWLYDTHSQTWSARGELPRANSVNWEWLAISPTNPQHMLLFWQSTASAWELYYSSNAGTTWTLVTSGALSGLISRLDSNLANRAYFVNDTEWVWSGAISVISTATAWRMLGNGATQVNAQFTHSSPVRVATLPNGDVLLSDATADAFFLIRYGETSITSAATLGQEIVGDATRDPLVGGLALNGQRTSVVKISNGGDTTSPFVIAQDHRDTGEAWANLPAGNTTTRNIAVATNNAGEVVVIRANATASQLVTDALGTPISTSAPAAWAVQADAQTEQYLVLASTTNDDTILIGPDGTQTTIAKPGIFDLSREATLGAIVVSGDLEAAGAGSLTLTIPRGYDGQSVTAKILTNVDGDGYRIIGPFPPATYNDEHGNCTLTADGLLECLAVQT